MTHYAAHRHQSGNDSVSRHAKSDACRPLDSPRTTRRTHFIFPKPHHATRLSVVELYNKYRSRGRLKLFNHDIARDRPKIILCGIELGRKTRFQLTVILVALPHTYLIKADDLSDKHYSDLNDGDFYRHLAYSIVSFLQFIFC